MYYMRKEILYLGSRGFPFEPSADIQRQIMISKILIKAGYDVTVICAKGIFKDNNIRFKGKFEKINYIYTSFTSKYCNQRFLRLVIKIFGRINEFFYILFKRILSNKKEIIFFVNTNSIYLLKYYRIISRIIQVKLIYDYVEYVKTLGSPNSYFKSNLKRFDQSVAKLSDNLICISDFLIEKIRVKAAEKKIIKIPAITDFDKFDKINKYYQSKKSYFLYCGSVEYKEAINFIVDSFKLILNNEVDLIIITNGSNAKINDLKDFLSTNIKQKQISILTNIEYEELISLYKNALALLIPLNLTLKDIARFPHKISEYTASKRPIITTNVGEIRNYFADNENAFIVTNFNIKEYAQKMEFVINNKYLADKIGLNGRSIGEQYFNYKSYVTNIHNFIEN